MIQHRQHRPDHAAESQGNHVISAASSAFSMISPSDIARAFEPGSLPSILTTSDQPLSVPILESGYGLGPLGRFRQYNLDAADLWPFVKQGYALDFTACHCCASL
ncbi:hypothetical protein [Methylobacterium sp. WL6]|uniref:hypothetical protein n=1 Tax=Methylobacterium sp. WL6 TaxID=2603901 RepID=UPI0011C985D1|nr:hypothetical protein [Methylobacterium sp. WL6]TXN72696.1 hypothetical protein FV230_03940 [Methylobacterium sp. WL6]